jgi:dihydrofolate reductase
MSSIKAMKQALEALENSRIFVTTREKIKHPEGTDWYNGVITALRQAIEQAEKQEPAAWIVGGKSIKIRLDMAGKLYYSESKVYGKDVVDKAIEQEREACAKVCDDADKSTHPAELADAIRARSLK